MSPCVLDAWLAGKCGAGAADLATAVREEQLVRLRAQLDYARARSPFYRERLQGVSGKHFSWDDLPGLPFTTARDILDWEKFLCVSHGDVERIVTLRTSGSSGPPKRLAFSRADLAATKDFFQAGMAQLVRAGDRALALWPGAARPYGVSALLREALGEQGITVFAGAPAATPAGLRREIAEYDPHVVIAAPRQLASLAALLAEAPWDGRRIALRGILSSAENLPPELADALQKRFGLQVLDHYGMTESGYGCGVECPAHDGHHLRELDLLVEIVDIASGVPLPDGELGEIVLTTLTREAMPLIRYRSGDAAAMLPGPCRCGSPLRRLSPVKGRIVREGATYDIAHIAKGHFGERTACASL